MSAPLAANLDVLRERFPHVLAWMEGARAPGDVLAPQTPRPTLSIAGLQLASGYDPRLEAAQQSELVPRHAASAACYGIGTGELPRALLARPDLRSLDVRLFHPGVAAAVLARFDGSDWLGDERVTVAPARELASPTAPFAAAPADLRLAEDGALALRDRIFLELATPYLRRHVAARVADLDARYGENRARVEADGDVATLFDTRAGCVAWVAGAGPTLDDHLAALAARDAGEPLIAVDAALASLVGAGAIPDVVVTMDAHREHQLALFDVDQAPLGETRLVYSPQVHPDVLDRWRGPRLAFTETARRADAARLGVARGELWSAGSVGHVAVDLAVRMGAREARLAGFDFANVGGRTHAAGMAHARDDDGTAARAGAFVLSIDGERVPSAPNLVGFLRDLEGYVASRAGVRFVNLSSSGARIAGAEHPNARGEAGA